EIINGSDGERVPDIGVAGLWIGPQQIAADRVAEQIRVLNDIADTVAPTDRRRTADWGVADRDLAGIGFKQPDQKVGESRLAGASWAAHTQGGPRRNGEVKALDARAGSARSVIMKTDVAKHDIARRDRRGGPHGNRHLERRDR